MGNYDSAWKDIVRAHLRPFLEFFFPRIAAEINFSVTPRFLDKELGKITGDSRQPNRYADFLIRTHLKSGEERLLLCHIEIQGAEERNFAERIFQYATRIYLRHDSFPASLMVLTDENPHFRPSGYSIERPGVSLELRFNTVKLQDYRHRREELAVSGNPFACVVEAQLEVNELRKRRGATGSLDREERGYILKKSLLKNMLRRGYEREYTGSLLQFIDWMLQLPEGREAELKRELEEESGGRDMPYVTSWERIAKKEGMKIGEQRGEQRGEEKGKLEDKQQVLTRLLERKFTLEQAEREEIAQTESAESLDVAIDTFVFATTKKEVLEKLKR